MLCPSAPLPTVTCQSDLLRRTCKYYSQGDTSWGLFCGFPPPECHAATLMQAGDPSRSSDEHYRRTGRHRRRGRARETGFMPVCPVRRTLYLLVYVSCWGFERSSCRLLVICGSRLSGWDRVSGTETGALGLAPEPFATSDGADPVARCGFGCKTRGARCDDTARVLSLRHGFFIQSTRRREQTRFSSCAQTAQSRALTSAAPLF